MPVYTYRCAQGHTWDEVRPIEGSETSEGPCPTCLEALDRGGHDLSFPGDEGHEDLSDFAGQKVPSQASVRVLRGTPTFYPGRSGK